MMLHRQSFLKLQEEDSVIQSILSNTCVVEKDVYNSFVLEIITYGECNENYFLPKEPDIIHQLLSCELDTSPISKVAIVDLTSTIEFSKGHNLHVNPKLPSIQKKQLTNLLQKHEKAFAWDYGDMKGLIPMLCTHRIH